MSTPTPHEPFAAFTQPLSPNGARRKSVWLFTLVAILGVAAVCAIAYLVYLRFYVLGIYSITSEGMSPSIRTGDHVVADRRARGGRGVGRDDIVVFLGPKEADPVGHQEIILIKRVIGLPGDTVEVKSAAVYLNGRRLNEPFIKEPMDDPQPAQARFGVGQRLSLAPGELYVLGDNRNDSTDSRYWGPLAADRIIAKAVSIALPADRSGPLQ